VEGHGSGRFQFIPAKSYIESFKRMGVREYERGSDYLPRLAPLLKLVFSCSCAQNSVNFQGDILPKELLGRSELYSSPHVSIISLVCMRFKKYFSSKHSSLSFPLKLSTKSILCWFAGINKSQIDWVYHSPILSWLYKLVIPEVSDTPTSPV
jgi:hypothetical protein